MPPKKQPKPLDIVAVRKSAGMNQSDFWGRLDVTQSGGSRYESGRKMPKPVERLFRLAYVMTALQAERELNKLRNWR